MEPSVQNTSKGRFKLYGATSFIFLTGALLGYLVMLQAYSVNDINDLLDRDKENNVFREMQLLNKKNGDFEEEIKELEVTLDQYSHRASYLQAVEEEIKRYQMLAGSIPVEGPGVEVRIGSKNLEPMWFVDIINELLNGGAEAIGINGIRIVEGNNGFDLLPNREILINDTTISGPFTFTAIGPSKELIDALNQQSGVLQRLSKNNPQDSFEIKEIETLKMDAVF